MKILQVLAGAAHGGAETAFVDMCLAMQEAGQTVEVVTRPNEGRVPKLKESGIPVHTAPFGSALDIYTPYKIQRVIKKFQPDIVQSWMSRASQKVRRWHPALGVPPYVVFSRLGGYYKIKNFQNTDRFITITPDIKRYLVEECGVLSSHVRHINNFAETEHYELPVAREAYNVPQGATLCLCLGRLHSSKAFDIMIRAIAQTPNAYLWVAGEGPDRAALEALITELNVKDRVTLLGWRDDRAALLAAADICVFPSRYEPFGTVFVQAWANHTPLITTAADGPRQFVKDHEDGLVVPVDDVDALSASIQEMAADPSLRKRLVEAGYTRYLNEFTKEKTVQAYLEYYAEALQTMRSGVTAQSKAAN